MSINAIGQGRPELQISRIGEKALEGAQEIKPIKDAGKDTKLNYQKDGNYSRDDINKAIDKLNTFLKDQDTHAEYSVHEKLNQIMIKIVDSTTDEVVLEIPPEKILDLVAKMCEMVGVLVDKKA